MRSMITASTTSPKLGLTSNGAGGGVLVDAFAEKLDAEVISGGAGDIVAIIENP